LRDLRATFLAGTHSGDRMRAANWVKILARRRG
jgi:hypothetical protein